MFFVHFTRTFFDSSITVRFSQRFVSHIFTRPQDRMKASFIEGRALKKDAFYTEASAKKSLPTIFEVGISSLKATVTRAKFA